MNDNFNHEYILDNQHRTVAEYLQRCLSKTAILRLVSAYFSIYGYEVLQKELHALNEVRFLFGDPGSIGEFDPGEKDPKAFVLTESGLTPNQILQQKHLAQQCSDWVSQESVKIRSIIQSNFLHGKLYLADRIDGTNAVVIGSSNFTKRGLGASSSSNLEINIATDSESVGDEFREWFDDIWEDKQRTKNVKKEVLATLARIGKNWPPELVYYKSLYELFRNDIDRRINSEQQLKEVHLYETQIWNRLYDFQKDGVKSVISRLQQHNGCILADSVGLGKTFTALAIIKFFELKNEQVLVLCPKKLRENWALFPVYNNQVNNPFLSDRFRYTLLNHTDLTRYSGFTGDTDLSNFNWGNFDLVVIDESHNFRNDSKSKIDADGKVQHSRYSRLIEEVIQRGLKTKVLMLSATPVNMSLIDLRNQIYFITEGRENDFEDSLGISHLGNLLAQAQKQFNQWEKNLSTLKQESKSNLLEKLGSDFFHLLGGISIARSRRHIVNYYTSELTRIGQFPKTLPPKNFYPKADLQNALSYEGLVSEIEEFSLSIYRPSSYVIDEQAKERLEREKQKYRFNQLDRERHLIGMIRTNFLKRLESSSFSLTKTLERTIGKIETLLEKISSFEQHPVNSEYASVLPDDDEDDDDFLISRSRTTYHLRELDLSSWKSDLLKDRAILTSVLHRVKVITPTRDGKLNVIRKHVKSKVESPSVNQDGVQNRKVLIFTTFTDTAEYLYENLKELAKDLNIYIAMVAGSKTRTTFGSNDFNSILTNFSPLSRERNGEASTIDIDLLIATDCISEGQNLQDCDTVVNYDIHWNPVRLIQRFGRIDRIGSRNKSVQMLNYWPTEDMEVYLKLTSRVEARMVLADAAASGDDDPLHDFSTLDESDIESALAFRDQQLLRLRKEEVFDLDELPDQVVISDFTLDSFFAQLLRYLEKNKELLETIPNGVFAITDTTDDDKYSGVIFFLRQRTISRDRREKSSSGIHPFYAVYIRNNGDIRYGCSNAKEVLNLFEHSSVGKIKPLQEFCDQFDQETQHGKNMSFYDELLNRVIEHIEIKNTDAYNKNLSSTGQRSFRLPIIDSDSSKAEFALVSWLIIKK